MSGQETLFSSRRHRYTRSSTASVTQLLSDSCSNFIQRLATRVRGPSQTYDPTPLKMRNRLEDKYSVSTSARQRIEKKYEKLRLNDFDKRCKTEHSNRLDGASENSVDKYSRSDSNMKPTGKRTSKLCVDDLVKSEELERSRPRDFYTANDKKMDVENAKKSSNRSLKDHRYTSMGSTRTRLEDKYAVVLDKYVKKKTDLQKAESPAAFSLKKSATTASVILSEKAYPFVASTSLIPREKTPYRANEGNKSNHRIRNNNVLNGEPRTSYHRSRPVRIETSEKPCLKLCSIEIDTGSVVRQDYSKSSIKKLKEASNVDDSISEREARRKEIQSLINKYVMLDEAYNKLESDVRNKTKETTVKSSAPKQTIPKRILNTAVSKQPRLFLQQHSDLSCLLSFFLLDLIFFLIQPPYGFSNSLLYLYSYSSKTSKLY